jgi:hypothetical protein
MAIRTARLLLLITAVFLGTGFIEHGPMPESGFQGSFHAYYCSAPGSLCDEESHLRGVSAVFGGSDVCDDYEPGSGDLSCSTVYSVDCIEGQEASQLVTSSFNEGEEAKGDFFAVSCGGRGGGGGVH